MHDPALRTEAERLIAEGVNDCEIARRLEVARTTVRDWRAPRYVQAKGAAPAGTCLRCWKRSKPVVFTPRDYAELLGLYLGDGSIATLGRTLRLRITLDTRYPGLISDAHRLVGSVLPFNRVDRVPSKGCVVISAYHSHLACLFPQHGLGKKHDRSVRLEPWQHRLIERAPWALLRGLFRSDGCAFVNRTGAYEYPSYDFSNRSADILDLYCETCERVGLDYRRYARSVRIYRRASVALMEEHVGTKS